MNIRKAFRRNSLLFLIWLRITEKIDCIKINKLKKMNDQERRAYISTMYMERIGCVLDWNNLKSYTEKMQWVKLYDSTPQKTMLADKYAVRNWIEKKIGKQYLIPLLGCWS